MPTPARKKPNIRESVRTRYNVEHIRPISAGGTDALDNMAWAWGGCNGRKGSATGAVDSGTNEWTEFYNPRQHEWATHFAWDVIDDAILTAQSSTGRVTLERLQLNRPEVVNLRRVMRFFDQYRVETM